MLSKNAMAFYADNIMDVVRVVVAQVLQYLKFDTRLVLEALFIADNFQGH